MKHLGYVGVLGVLVLAGCAGPQAACSGPVCPIARWPMNETSGNAVADGVANPIFNTGQAMPGPIGPLPGGQGPYAVTGHAQGALYFPGNGSRYVRVPSTPDLNPSYAFLHLEAWVAPVGCGAGAYYPILDKWDAITQNGYALYLEGVGAGQVRAVLRVGTSTFTSSTPFPANFNPGNGTGTWTHVAVTLDGPYSAFRVNGIPAGTFLPPAGTASNGLELWLGALHTPPAGLYPCEIALDEVVLGRLDASSSQQ